jgi:hypothetical protein
LGRGCPSAALAFNMHSAVMPLLESAGVSAETKRPIADLVVQERKLIAGTRGSRSPIVDGILYYLDLVPLRG